MNDERARHMSVLNYTDASAMTADAINAAKTVNEDCGSPVVVELSTWTRAMGVCHVTDGA